MPAKWRLHLIANTHWDREWYLSFESYRLRLVKLFDRLLATLSRDNHFRSFLLDGQFSALEDYLELRPEKEKEIRAFIDAGRLEIGPWYTQPHETMAGGEALIRNLMRGIRASRRFGGALPISYNIDQFGHISQMPQLLRGCGIDRALGWRGVPPELPAVFRWCGPDGSAIHFFYSNRGYGEATALPESLEDFIEVCEHTPFPRPGLRTRIDKLLALRTPSCTGQHLLCLSGVDHSFAQENLPQLVELINRSCPEVQAVQSTLQEYTDAVLSDLVERELKLAEHYGELLDPRELILQDAHSVRPNVKQTNRLVERLLQDWAEPFALATWASGLLPYPQAALERAWMLLLQNQAHDSHACSSAEKVFRQVMSRFEQAEDIAREIIEESLLALTNASGSSTEQELTLCVFNPLGHARDEVIVTEIDIPQALGWRHFGIFSGETEIAAIIEEHEHGQHIRYNPFRGHPTFIPIQRWRVTFRCATLPALGFNRFTLRSIPVSRNLPGSLLSSLRTIENEFLRVEVQPDGSFTLSDKRNGRNYPGLHFLEDSGEAGDGYIHRAPQENRTILSTGLPAQISICRDNALEAELEIRIELPLPNGLSPDRMRRGEQTASCLVLTRLRLCAGLQRLDITTTIENHAHDHRLRAILPTGITDAYALAGQPFDEAHRKANSEFPSTRPFQGHLDITNENGGLMIASDDLCEYELRADASSSVALTLLRATDQLGCSFTNPEHIMHSAQCQERLTLRYSLIPHGKDHSEARYQAQCAATPPATVIGKECEEAVLPGYQQVRLSTPIDTTLQMLELSEPEIIVSALKRHEDRESIVIRLFNASERGCSTKLRMNFPDCRTTQAWSLNLLEERSSSLICDNEGFYLLQFKPKELCTVELCI